MHCPYCGKRAILTDSKEVYGRSYGMIYLCRPCNAYVGVHPGTHNPLGTLANAELRQARQRAHAAFDPIWRNGGLTRKQAYTWMAQTLGITKEKAHIAKFTVKQCNDLTQAVAENASIRLE